MDILKAYSLLGINHPVNIQGTLENPLFQANQIGKILDIKKVRNSIKDFDDDERTIITVGTLGGQQETIFLTEIGLYRLISRSTKPIAVIFQKWMINILREIRITGMYQLQKDKEVDKKLMEHNCSLINHNTLMKAYHKKSVVYICKMKEVKDKFVIKIGSTQNIKERMYNLANNQHLIEPLLLDVFECDNHTKFERFLHKHKFISNCNYEMIIKNGEVSKETYLVNQEIYKEIIKIINERKMDYQMTSLQLEELRNENEKICENTEILRNENEIIAMKRVELELENEKIKLRQKEIELEIKKMDNKLLEENKLLVNTIEESDNEEENNIMKDVTTSNFTIKKRINGINVSKVYQYNPTDLTTYIRVFDSPADVEREVDDISPAPLRSAAKNNTIYKGYRWVFIRRNDTPPESISPTIETKHKSPDVHFVAMIDIKKTQIMAVYKNQKEATEARNMKCNSFNRAINLGTISSGHYWNFFDKCSEEMKTEYLSHSQLPKKYVSPCGKNVQQIDPQTGQVLKTYTSNREVIKLFQIAAVTLRNVAKTGEITKGYKWKIV